MKIGVIGCGYVGLTVAAAYAQYVDVGLWDSDKTKIQMIMQKKQPFKNNGLEDVFCAGNVRFGYYDEFEAFISANDIYFIAVPTDYNEKQNGLNTSILEDVIKEIFKNKKSYFRIIIKSTLPIGFIDYIREKYQSDNIFYMPEFLREGNAYYDFTHPQRIVIGGEHEKLLDIINLYKQILEKNIDKPHIMFVSTKDAEAIKLFSNAYLAMRVAFFNEIDTIAEIHNMNSNSIIEGVSGDKRIGNFYNNPSFGYGGYCLPKDTKELSRYCGDESVLLRAVSSANRKRKQYFYNKFLKEKKTIGIYRLTMKKESDNLRSSSLYDIVTDLSTEKKIIVYEPLLNKAEVRDGVELIESLEKLADRCDVIITNRMTIELLPYKDKVYTRDIFFRD